MPFLQVRSGAAIILDVESLSHCKSTIEEWITVSASIPVERLLSARVRLNQHPVYGAIQDLPSVRLFMSHHIYSVWDFMSLLKYLQQQIAPHSQPWRPYSSPRIRRFINDIVLEEESDLAPPSATGIPGYASHFELYLQAMAEVGCSTAGVIEFTNRAALLGFRQAAVQAEGVPAGALAFMSKTFSFIETGKPHVVAAAFALGREHIIPAMFRELLQKMAIGKEQAPCFHYYLERHIHLDEDHHGPMSLLMLEELCQGDAVRIEEVITAAQEAIQARIAFWDSVLAVLS
ncbi:MAG: DUF3050 domain-containing protein [Magnetococcales bacterium]|nr:DUF3050 domain-containing protein [Magnetococcales bacterium]MBF0113942.1 DUF3050 domain-containing protein [Magnetococcales bacterium]